MQAVTAKIPVSELLVPCSDWNGHVGSTGAGYEGVHGGFGYGKPNPDVAGERVLEFAQANGLVVGNTCFKKRDSHLVTYRSGSAETQIDYIRFRTSMHSTVQNVKVIPYEECAPKHELLVCDFKVSKPQVTKRKFEPRLKT